MANPNGKKAKITKAERSMKQHCQIMSAEAAAAMKFLGLSEITVNGVIQSRPDEDSCQMHLKLSIAKKDSITDEVRDLVLAAIKVNLYLAWTCFVED